MGHRPPEPEAAGQPQTGGAARDARFLLRKHGLLQAASYESAADPAAESATGQTIAGLLVPLADDLVHELHNLTAYIRSGRADVAFDALGVYGDGAEVAGLAAYFGGELNMDAQSMDPWLRVPPAVRRTGPGAGPAASALALGLALRRVRWL
jgi:Tfp pilus assembly PilM family ATPase